MKPITDLDETTRKQALDVLKALEKDKAVVTCKDSSGIFAAYFEMQALSGTDLRFVIKVMVTNERFVVQQRHIERRAASWVVHKLDPKLVETEGVLSQVLDHIAKLQRGSYTYTMRGKVIFVELNPTDVDLLNRGEAPVARYRGQTAYTKLYGDPFKAAA